MAATQINEGWAMDFMSDSLYCGKRFRALNIIDESTRGCPAIACLRCWSEHIKNRQLHNLNYSLVTELYSAFINE